MSTIVAIAASALAQSRRVAGPTATPAITSAGSVRITLADGRAVTATIDPRSLRRRSFYVHDAPCGSCVGEHVSLEWRAVSTGGSPVTLHVRIDVANPNSRNMHGPAQSFRSGERYPGRLDIDWTVAGTPSIDVPGIVDLDRMIVEPSGVLRITFRPIPGTQPPFREFVANVVLPPPVREPGH